MKTKKSWKKDNWDMWTFGKKVRHVLAVIASITTVVLLFVIMAYALLILFGMHGFLLHIRDEFILGMINWISGG